MLTGPLKTKVGVITKMIHQERWRDSVEAIAELTKLKDFRLPDDNPEDCYPMVWGFVESLLNSGGMEEAAQILWSERLFDPRSRASRDVWKLFDEASFGLILGAASMSKSYSLGVRLFLEWIRDPMWTTVKVVGPSEDHLQANLFSHLVSLHQGSRIPLPGKIGDLFIGMDRRDRLSSISGIVIPTGQNKRAGRLQGGKRKPRKERHPVFGELSRMFIFIDEAEVVPKGIWSDVDNVMANFTTEDAQGLRIFAAYNPADQAGPTGERAEPVKGWAAFDIDQDFRWTSKRGWEVLRLDAEKSENVIEGRTLFPGLQTREGLEKVKQSAGGPMSAGYYTMGRGAYPPQGAAMTVIPAGIWARMRGTPIWYESPKEAGSTDMALEGSATAVQTLGKWGRASGVKYPPSLQFPQGRTVMFKDGNGMVTPRWIAWAESQLHLPKAATRGMTDEILRVNRSAGVRPDLYAIDRTGNGAGTADLLRYEWSEAIVDVNYSQAPSEVKIMSEDTKLPKEEFFRMDSELWFATRAWGEFGFLMLSPELPMGELTQQATQRRYTTSGGKSKVESKKDYKDRGFTSPDEMDSLTLFVHAIRMGSKMIPSMRGGALDSRDADDEENLEEDDMWYSQRGVRLDPTSRSDVLQDGGSYGGGGRE